MSQSHTVRFNGEKLRELREARKFDQHRLAERARRYGTGITQASVSRHENGMQPSGANALAYARALDIDVAELYGLDADQPDDEDEALSRDDLLTALAPLAKLLQRAAQS